MLFLGVLALLVAMPGCQSAEPATLHGASRSIVFDAPDLRCRLEATPHNELPWYASRNDFLPTVLAGTRSPIYERSVNVTIDRRTVHGNTIRDHYNSSTYRHTVFESIR